MTMTAMPDDSFDELNRNRSRAVTALGSLADAAALLRADRRSQQLREMASQVANDWFRLAFVGRFDAGKSTLINALLGERLLPAIYTPTTGAVTVIRYGPQREAWLIRDGNHAQPEAVPIEDLDKYLTIDDDAENPDPIIRVEIALPSELLRNGIEIVDTPGLDEPEKNGEARTHMVVEYLPNTDAVVFVTQIGGAMGDRERAFVTDTLHPLGLHDLFITCTHASDLLDLPQDERVWTVGKIRSSVANLVPGERVFFVDSVRALRAQVSGDGAAPAAESGVPYLDQCLRRFLSRERGTVKLTRAVGVGLEVSDEMAAVVTARRKTMDDAAEQDRENVDKVIKTLLIMYRQRDSVLATADSIAALIEPEAEAKARDFLLEIAQRCPQWLDDLPPRAKVPFRDIYKVKQRVDTVTNAVTQHFSDHFRREVSRWQQDLLTPYLLKRGADLKANAEEEIVELFKLSAQALRALDYLGADEEEVTPELLAQYFTDLDLRGALGDAGSPGVPNVMGKLIAHAAIMVAVSVLTASFRFLLTLVSLVQAVVRGIKPGDFEAYIATLAAKRIAAEFRANAPQWGIEVRAAVATAFQDVRTKLKDGMDNRITDVAQRAASRIALLEGDQAAEKERLDRAEERIQLARSLIDGDRP
jgi:Dynamin family